MIHSALRIGRYALQNFFRNFWLSLATLLVMVILIFLINVIIGVNEIKTSVLSSVNQKIDLALFFRQGIPESDVLAIKAELEKQSAITSVTVINPEEGLRRLQDEFPKIGERIVPALETNPLGYKLEIKTVNLQDHQELLQALETDERIGSKLEKTNFLDSRAIAAQAALISDRINYGAIALAALLSVIAVIIIFNTIRVSMYTHRDEIAIMKLVGATNSFIRMPFLVEAALYSLIAVGVVLSVLFFALDILQPYVDRFFAGLTVVNLADFYVTNFMAIFGAQFLALLLLNACSTGLALRRYLK